MDGPLTPRAVWRGIVLLGHVYSTALWHRSIVAPITARPLSWETRETLAGVEMRVGWWRPGRGARHPAMLFVIGATPEGIDFPELRVGAEAFARAGFLIMVPDLPFMREERLDPTGPAQIAAAFHALRRHPAAREPVGAFGFSVGGGFLLAAAARDTRLASAPYLAVLGAYFDMTTYIASIASRSQRRDGGTTEWEPSPDVPDRMRAAAAKITMDPEGRAALDRVTAARSYEDALARLRELPPSVGDALEQLSPSPLWDRIRAPVFWVHDEKDLYVPIAEAEAARRAPRHGQLRMLVPRLLQHAVPVADAARAKGARFWIGELWRLLRFATSVLRAAG